MVSDWDTSDQTVRDLQREVSDWADATFPDRTLESIIGKFREEYQELMDSLRDTGAIDRLELADVLILALDAATKAGIDVISAVKEKIRINRGRVWVVDPTTGLMRHVEEPLAIFVGGPLDGGRGRLSLISGDAIAHCVPGHDGEYRLENRLGPDFIYRWAEA